MILALTLALGSLAVFASGEDGSAPAREAGAEQENRESLYDLLAERVSELSEPDNVVRAVTWISSLISVLIITLIRGSIIKLRNKISGTLDNTTEKTNELVESYNENNRKIDRLECALDELTKKTDDRNVYDRETYEALCTFADMLFTVYNNSTTIPEGMKELLREKYSGLLKAANGAGGGV